MTRLTPIALLALNLVAAANVSSQEIRWHDNYGAAMEEVQRTNKPMLLAFRCVP